MASQLAYKAVLDTLYFSGAQTVARFWFGGLGSILMLHRVDDRRAGEFAPNDHLTVSPGFLDRLFRRLRRAGYEFISMDEVVTRLETYKPRRWREPFIAVTLDDGYRDNLVNAVPVFRKHAIPFTIYVAPGLVEGRATLWWEDLEAVIASRDRFLLESPNGRIEFDVSTVAKKDRAYGEILALLTRGVDEDEQRRLVAGLTRQAGIDAKASCARSIMGWREIVELSRDPLCTIGAHTVRHFALARLSAERAMAEIEESASILEMELGRRPRHLAYPYGYPAAAGKREFAMARQAGFASAVTTRHGVLYPGHVDHMHALPRISLNGHFQAKRYVDTLLSGLPTRLANGGRALNVA
ncbi:MAG: polysaccharide deacetylase family protein [Pseudomonadota bacterium]|nr:polysaccharide deacetylase family protein [Pseudomonadota bacterium]